VFGNWNDQHNRLRDPGLVGSLVLAVRHWGFTAEHLFTAFLEAYHFPLLFTPASATTSAPAPLFLTPSAAVLLPFRYVSGQPPTASNNSHSSGSSRV
jgi:hypothetical protein